MRAFASFLPPSLRRTVVVAQRTAAALSALVLLAACDALNPNKEACSVTIAPTSFTVAVNGSQLVNGTAFDCDGNSMQNKTVNFSSANSAIATVTAGGQVIGISVGQTTVSATANGKSGTAQVTVVAQPPTTVTISPANFTLRLTNVRQFTAVARNSEGNPVTGRTFVWASSNSAVASVDPSGNVSALGIGTATITAVTDGITGASNVTVTNIPIGACSLSPTSQTVTVSAQSQPTLTLRDTANNVLPPLGRPITWVSDNEIVATVSTSGVITARQAGTARITASSVEYPSISCATNFTAVNPRIATATIQPQTGQLRIGIPRQFTVTLADSVGGAIPPGRVVTWTSATPAIATVSATGLVTGIALGSARIAVRAEGAVDTVTFSVTKIPVAVVRLSPLSSSVIQGTPVQLTATVEDSAGTVVTDRVIEWTSSDPTRATVSGTGLVSTLAPGAVLISAISETRVGQSTIAILPIPVDSIVADANYTAALNAQNKSFAITLRDAAGNQLFNRNVSVTSSVPAVATGVVNGQSTAVLITTGSTVGQTTFTLRALNANGQPEGKTTTVTVVITAAVP